MPRRLLAGLAAVVATCGPALAETPVERGGYYKTWTSEDLDALIAWIRTIPPIE